MNGTSVAERYREVWHDFVDEMLRTCEELRTAAQREGADLHALLTACQAVPYDEAHRLMEDGADKTSNNIGSITGLFFEQIAAALVTGYLSSRVPDVRVERNTCSDSSLVGIARDPDIFLSLGGRRVVFEIKVAPKKRDLAWVRSLRQGYEDHEARYYLIGGYASLTRGDLQVLVSERWACFTASSGRNRVELEKLPRLDDLVRQAASFLGDS